MTIFETVVIGIVEGLTEFLPVSSTGHIMIAGKFLAINIEDDFVKAFTVIIQFGAILSVLVLYWQRFLQSWKFYWKLLVGFIPAAIFGPLLDNKIDSWLGNITIVAYMLIIGGIVMLFVDKLFNRPTKNQEITYKRSLTIGLFQCIAMIPGVSRSMSSIVGGMTQRLTRKNAAEFSFFLAVPTMAAASGYKIFKEFILKSDGLEVLKLNTNTLLIGSIVSFIVGLIAIKFFISFITKYGFKFFGWYRIVAGLFILILIWKGIIL